MTPSLNIVVIDNYDSFTYNLVHLLEAEGAQCVVMRNDEMEWETIAHCDGLILGPGPGLPKEAGELMSVIAKHASNKPMLGICLGHQALAEFFGGRLINLDRVFHGKEEIIEWVEDNALIEQLPREMKVGLYHSWGVEPLPSCEWFVTARSVHGVVMGLQHSDKPIFGVQFHPESVMTPMGRQLLRNWLNSLESSSK
jgi:anthranilate synthase component II